MRTTAIAFLFLTLARAMADPPSPKETETFLEANVPCAPTPAMGSDGITYLLYEIHLTYLPVFPTESEIVIERIDVMDGTPRVIRCYLSFEGKELEQISRRLGHTKANPLHLSPNQRTIVFVFLPLEKGKPIPTSLRHTITVQDPSAEKKKILDAAVTLVKQDAPLVIGPPLKGGGWMAVNGPGVANAHRCACIPYKGTAHVAQRFAIDWVQIDAKGQTLREGADPAKSASYYCYGAEAIAVADGEVVALRDGRPDNEPVGSIDEKAKVVEGLAGNFAVLDLGRGQYAVYCHIQPGSFKVKKGDKVKRGKTIGLVGNAGNSSEPHLHFHVATAVDIFSGEGIPYQIDAFEILVTPEEGKAIEKAVDEKKPVTVDLSKGKNAGNAIPLESTVVRFISDKERRLAR